MRSSHLRSPINHPSNGSKCQISIDEHIDHLCVVFNAQRDAYLFGNLEKCTFCTDRVSFLGYLVTRQGIEVDHARVEAIHG
jgi:hypothetical protein